MQAIELELQEGYSMGQYLPPPWRLTRVALMLAALTFASYLLNQNSWLAGGVTVLWPSNGLLMGILLCSPKRHWPAYVATAAIIDFLTNVGLHDAVYIGAYLSSCNMLEALLGAMLLYPIIAPKPDLTRRKQLLAFLGYGVVVAPLIASILASFAQRGYFALPSFHDFHRWFTADALGIAIVTPLCLAYGRRDGFASRSWREVLGSFSMLSLVTVVVFWQTQYPLLFVILPFLLLPGLRLGLAGSALGLLLVSVIGGALSAAGHGPVGLVQTASVAERDLIFQAFIAVSMLVLYIVEALMAESARLQTHLQGSERRFRLLAEASNDIIFLSDLEGRRTYVSPSVSDVLGWSIDEILSGTFRDLVHPEDGDALGRMLDTYRETRVLPPPGEFRYRKAAGSYIWLEFSIRLHFDEVTGEPAGFVCVARDISRRKAEDANLQQTLKTVEHLASSDALTGIANRRHFDNVLEREWLRAAREQTSLSLLLLDVDRFKAYNDVFGHLSGDECLRRVVTVIEPLIDRPADLLARYGGEEFVVVLPRTDAAGARQMAEWICQTVRESCLPHPANAPYGVVTMSIGCATLKPHPEFTHLQLVELADAALYRAKFSGRNCVHLAQTQSEVGTVALKI